MTSPAESPTISVSELYGEWTLSDAEFNGFLASLPAARPASTMDELALAHLDEGRVLLDVGCRTGAHALRLARASGCTAMGVDPIADHIEKASSRVPSSLRERIEFAVGSAETLPVDDSSVDVIWCRDTLTHCADLDRVFTEFARVLRAGGVAVVHATAATGELRADEAEQLYGPLAVEASSMDPAHVRACAQRAGFGVELDDPMGSEWREAWEADGRNLTSKQLVRVAEMRRNRAAIVDRVGDRFYAAELANALWGVFQMLGKLEARVWVFRRP